MCYTCKSPILEIISKKFPDRIKELEGIFKGKTNMYIDFANVIPWQARLGWNTDINRMNKFFKYFSNINDLKIYYGTLNGDKKSEDFIHEAQTLGYIVKTKDVKIMKKSIDVSSIPLNSPSILVNFIRKPFLDNLKVSDIEYLNTKLKELNDNGIKYLEDKKCNFDVEMGTDILLDLHFGEIETFIIWSGDSDFYDIIKQLQSAGKNVYIFGTSRKISKELNDSGAKIYDIQKIRNFICWKKQIQDGILPKTNP